MRLAPFIKEIFGGVRSGITATALIAFVVGPGIASNAQVPTITTQPRSLCRAAGLNVSFTADFSGGTTLQYQWQFYSTNLPGATGTAFFNGTASLSLTNIQFSNSGPYRLVVTNNSGSVTSAGAQLVVGTVAVWGDGFFGQTNIALDATNVIAIAAGSAHTVALKRDGTVTAWGRNVSGVTNVPNALSNVVAITASGNYSAALRGDGTIVCWGDSTFGKTTVPADLTNAIAVAAGGSQCMAVRSDGSVRVWGDNQSGQTNVPWGLKAVGIGSGFNYCLAITPQGTVVAWGYNGSGQTKVPTDLSNVVAVAGGQNHSVALKADGTVAAWGDNSAGQTNIPASATNIIAIAAGSSSCLALRNDGLIIGWGSGIFNVPAGFSNIVSIAAGSAHTAGLRNFGSPAISLNPASQTLWAGQPLTLYSMAAGTQPLTYQWQFNGTNIPGATSSSLGITSLQQSDAGSYSVVVGNSSGSVTSRVAVVTVRPQVTIAAWGANGNGESFPPLPSSNIVAIAGGNSRGLMLLDNGTVKAWGGSGGYESLKPLNLTNAIAIASGDLYDFALKADGSTACWGRPLSFVFTNISFSGRVTAIAAGAYHRLGLTSSGTVLAIADTSGPLPLFYEIPPAGLSGVKAIAAGYGHSLALKTDGTVVAWGFNTSGATNVPPGVSNVMAIACGYNHQLALLSNGTVVAWGDNSMGQTAVPPDLTNVVAIASHGHHNLALKADSTVVGWGWDYYKQSSSPIGLTNVVAIAAGQGNSFALVGDSAPCVTLPPRSQSVPSGGTVVLQPTVTGKSTVTYQWLREGTNVTGATNLSLALSNVQSATTGNYALSASKSLGSVTSRWANLTLGPIVTWGDNSSEQLFVPPDLVNPAAVAAGASASCALNPDGTMAIWGYDEFETPAPTNVAVVAPGPYFTTVVLRDGSVAVLGTVSYAPTNVPNNLPPIAATASGFNHVVAVARDGHVYSWSMLAGGQTNVPAGLSNCVASAAGNAHSMALRDDGTVVCWGSITAAPAGLSNVVAIAAAVGHSLALKADGTVVAWGDNSFGVSTVPASATNAVAIATSLQNGLAVRADGSLVIWGSGASGQLNIPLVLHDLFSAAVGYTYVLAIAGDGSPHITVQPFSRWVTGRTTATLQVMTAGHQPLSYQWLFNGTNIAGATNSMLTLNNLLFTSAGNYQCIVSNAFGTTISSNATVNVLRPPLLLTAINQPNSGVKLTLNGLMQSGPAVLLVSTNFVDWQGLATNPATLGSWEYQDSSTNALIRFYRAFEMQ